MKPHESLAQIRPRKFNVYSYLDVAETLVEADESLLALQVLDSLPAFYRDFPPDEITSLRAHITSKIMVTRDYVSHRDDSLMGDLERLGETIENVTRGKIILQDVLEANSRGVTPHLIDMGPGEYWMPYGLRLKGAKFTYEPLFLDPLSKNKAVELIGDVFTNGTGERWFVAFEIVEHLLNPIEMKVNFNRYQNVERIYISTPTYAYNGGNPRWRDEPTGHVRSYTPGEFELFAKASFPGFVWNFWADAVMVLKGTIQR